MLLKYKLAGSQRCPEATSGASLLFLLFNFLFGLLGHRWLWALSHAERKAWSDFKRKSSFFHWERPTMVCCKPRSVQDVTGHHGWCSSDSTASWAFFFLSSELSSDESLPAFFLSQEPTAWFWTGRLLYCHMLPLDLALRLGQEMRFGLQPSFLTTFSSFFSFSSFFFSSLSWSLAQAEWVGKTNHLSCKLSVFKIVKWSSTQVK